VWTVADVRRAVAERKIAALMGMEGGHMVDRDLRRSRTHSEFDESRIPRAMKSTCCAECV